MNKFVLSLGGYLPRPIGCCGPSGVGSTVGGIGEPALITPAAVEQRLVELPMGAESSAALALGASGVQMGTAYLFCPEANVAPLA